jgi:hypothetical protein
MAFHREGIRIVESSGLFAVERVMPDGLRYYENEHVMYVQGSMARDGLDVRSKAFSSWLPPHNAEAIDEAKRESIIANIRSALESEGDALYVFG